MDVAAWQRGGRCRRSECIAPDHVTRYGIQRVDDVRFSRDDQQSARRAGRAPVERLGIDMPLDRAVEAHVPMQAWRTLPGEARHDILAASVAGVVGGGD